ncbi:MAG: hypothetical protein ACI8PQ_001760 [Planctomycetota bacterium]
MDGKAIEVPLSVSNQDEAFWPDYRQDVMPILSRAGCNTGSCHGAADGQNGFSLSLRGYDPISDHAALTDEFSARRFDRVSPGASLFLQKPSASVPHEGGQVLKPGSPEYRVLLAWVAASAPLEGVAPELDHIEIVPSQVTIPLPGMEHQVRVVATFSDGSVRDVTTHAFVETSDIEVTAVSGDGLVTALRRGEASVLARYEGRYAASRFVVMGDRSGFEWPADEVGSHPIDAIVNAKLRRVRVQPSGLCTDDEFLRRVRIDLTGTLPSVEEVQTFLLDSRPSSRKRLEIIDRLIGSPEFVEYWTNKWCDLLLVTPEALGDEGAASFREWVRARVASNSPYDGFVRDLISSSGTTAESPASAFHRILREPDAAMEATTQLFLGVRFNCNKCHDHPFEQWTQDQHWQLAAYYRQVSRVPVEGMRDEVIGDEASIEVKYPDGIRVASPGLPFELLDVPQGPSAPSLRIELSEWLTAKENPYFASSFVNRVWSYLLGVGLIEPVDDIRAGNPASNPELHKYLTARFIDGGFDFRDLLREILTSRTYQRSLGSNDWNADDHINFSHATARRLPAEVLLDAVHQATGVRLGFSGVRPGTRAVQVDDRQLDTPDGFLALFGRPPRESPCECERVQNVSLGQALNLLNGETVAAAIHAPQNALAELVAFEDDDRAVIDELFLRFLSRPASMEEAAQLVPTMDIRDPGNLSALPPETLSAYELARADWEEKNRATGDWHALAMQPASHVQGGAQLILQEDMSILLEGENPETDELYLVFSSELERVTGLQLEVMSDPSLPGNGPGRAKNGNFVLGNLEVAVMPLSNPASSRALVFSQASASYSQESFPVAAAIDADPNTGWAISPRVGESHVAVFELKEDLISPGGFLLGIKISHPFGGSHTLGRFRITATNSERPVRASLLPKATLLALSTPVADRDLPARRLVHETFIETRGDLGAAIRLGAVRDLSWALANSSAFLFNR